MRPIGTLVHRLNLLRASCRRLGIPVAAGARRYWGLTTHERFGPDEIFMLDLLDGRSERNPEDFLPKDVLLQWQLVLNPREHFPWTEDKPTFHARAERAGLRHAGVLCTLKGAGAQSPPDFQYAEALLAHLHATGPAEVVLKPADGLHGASIIALRAVEGGGFVTPDGEPFDARGWTQSMHAEGFDRWLAQERLRPHPALAQLSATRSIQTLRLVTLREPDGSISVIACFLKLIAGDNVTDNFNWGLSGNLVAVLGEDARTLDYALTNLEVGLARVEHHPVSGKALSGFAVPDADAAIDLVKRAAEAFAPLVTIGWDVALTDSGPVLIEGNVTWDPFPILGSWRKARMALQRALAAAGAASSLPQPQMGRAA